MTQDVDFLDTDILGMLYAATQKDSKIYAVLRSEIHFILFVICFYSCLGVLRPSGTLSEHLLDITHLLNIWAPREGVCFAVHSQAIGTQQK